MAVHQIVIPLHKGGGKHGNNAELKFVLRGLEEHFKDDFNLTIIGERCPQWLKGARHIKQKGGLKTALCAAAREYPDGFFWCYDDCVAIRDTTADQMKVAFAKTRWQSATTGWAGGLEKIRVRLVKEGHPARDYSRPHGPYWFDKGMVDEGFKDWPGMAGKFPWESWILSKRDWPFRSGGVKQYYGDFSATPGEKAWFVNFNERGFTKELQQWLGERFPAPSRFEKENGHVEGAAGGAPLLVVVSRRAISFSLYGDQAKYSAGMCQNVELARQFYPGWEVVVHIEKGHYSIERLASLDARLIIHDSVPGQRGAAWRYETGDDVGRYDHVVFRDADSRLNPREKAAVDDWIASGKALHVMRDHPKHTTPILSGMFGVRTGAFDFGKILKDWKGGRDFNDGEKLLARTLWPELRTDAVVHVKSPSAEGESEFPEHSEWPGHVGQREEPRLNDVRVVLLSPEKYKARRQRFMQSFKENAGFLNQIPLEWFRATPYEELFAPPSFKKFKKGNHWWAATCDHLEIMESALVAGVEHLIIFEDDASFTADFEEIFWRTWASLPPNWKAVRLGWNKRWDAEKGGHPPVIPKVLNRCNPNGQGMFATLWNRKGLLRAYDHCWHRRGMLIDEAFEDLRRREPRDWYQPAKMICQVDPLAEQLGGDS